MTGTVHDALRQLRVLSRTVRHSRLVRGARRIDAIRGGLEAVYHGTNRYLRSLGVDYWIVYGTLLGWHREGRPIDGDHDVDFAAPEGEYPGIWAGRRALPPGFRMYDTSHKHHGPKLYVVHRGWEADIYFYREKDGWMQSLEKSGYLNETAPVRRDLVYPVRDAEFLGEPTRVPADPEAWLRHTYHYIGRDGVRDEATGYWRPRAARSRS